MVYSSASKQNRRISTHCFLPYTVSPTLSVEWDIFPFWYKLVLDPFIFPAAWVTMDPRTGAGDAGVPSRIARGFRLLEKRQQLTQVSSSAYDRMKGPDRAFQIPCFWQMLISTFGMYLRSHLEETPPPTYLNPLGYFQPRSGLQTRTARVLPRPGTPPPPLVLPIEVYVYGAAKNIY